MAEDKTAEQVRAERTERLGPRLGPVYHALADDLAWLQIKWAQYRELFGRSPERIALLNSAAGLFFRVLQDTLWEDTLLHLARLTDPAETAGKPNLSIRRIPELCDDPELRSTLSELVDDAVAATEFARDWRNRDISHRDLSLALNTAAQPLLPASRAQVSTALSAIHRIFNEVSERVFEATLADDVITPPTGAESLIYVIRDGLEAQEAREERIRSGQFTEEDLRHRAV